MSSRFLCVKVDSSCARGEKIAIARNFFALFTKYIFLQRLPLHVGVVSLYSQLPLDRHSLVSVAISTPMWYPLGQNSVQNLGYGWVPLLQSSGEKVPTASTGSSGQCTPFKLNENHIQMFGLWNGILPTYTCFILLIKHGKIVRDTFK